MMTRPAGWDTIWSSPHRTEWRYTIGGVIYTPEYVQGTPVIKRPLMDRPSIGRCCTGDLTISVRDHSINITVDNSVLSFSKSSAASVSGSVLNVKYGNVKNETLFFDTVGRIPRAADVVAECRLVGKQDSSDWAVMGHYFVTKRSKSGTLTTLTCRDSMILAGRPYINKTAIREWPAPMSTVVHEIAGLMGIELDPRTIIRSGSIYRVSYPNEDTLMTEILANVAAAHGGSFVITAENKLRLILFPATAAPVLDIGGRYNGYTPYSTGEQTVSRVTISDNADNQFSTGTDDGVELACECIYATQAMVNMFNNWLVGSTFFPFSMDTARLDPLIELGDTFRIRVSGKDQDLIACSMEIACDANCTVTVSNYMDEDDEEEIPYVSPDELRAKRFIDTTKSYRGNRINRTEGFVSEYMENDEPVARMIANSDQFAMQRVNPDTGAWDDVLFFDTVKRTYKFLGEVDIEAEPGNQTFCQDVAPTLDVRVGDLWIDSGDNYKLHRYDGTEWVSVQDMNIPDLIGQLAAANTSLNVLSTGIDAKVDSTYLTDQLNGLVRTFTSALELKANELTLGFEGTAQDAAESVNERFSTLIRASGDGVEIGKSGSNFRVILDNEEMSFFDGTTKLAYMSNQKMFITSAQVTSSLEIGQDGGNTFSWVKTSNGLSLSYVSAG